MFFHLWSIMTVLIFNLQVFETVPFVFFKSYLSIEWSLIAFYNLHTCLINLRPCTSYIRSSLWWSLFVHQYCRAVCWCFCNTDKVTVCCAPIILSYWKANSLTVMMMRRRRSSSRWLLSGSKLRGDFGALKIKLKKLKKNWNEINSWLEKFLEVFLVVVLSKHTTRISCRVT